MKLSTVLVTGSSGLIGSEAVKHFDRQAPARSRIVSKQIPDVAFQWKLFCSAMTTALRRSAMSSACDRQFAKRMPDSHNTIHAIRHAPLPSFGLGLESFERAIALGLN
jgi:hypothetical protein